jgi:glycosyltransferase involved in cell wall biosynthesis
MPAPEASPEVHPEGNPEVSYVVTLYQKRDFLPFLCAGLAAQGLDDAEFVFVDDGSTDGTAEALREVTAGWPRVTLVEQRNQGPSAALNRGLALARGRYVKPVDGDDVLLPGATAHLLAALRTTGCAAALAFAEDQRWYDPASETPAAVLGAPVGPGGVTAQDLLPLTLLRAQSSPSHWLFERALLGRIGGADPAVFIQDYSLELEIVRATRVAVARGAALAIPRAAAGRMSDNEAQTLHDMNAALIRFLRRHPDLPAGLRRRALLRAAGRAARWAMRRGGEGWLARSSIARLPAGLGLLRPDRATETLLCAPFERTHRIRRPEA